MDPEDQSSWRRLPDPGAPAASTGPDARDRGLRHVQRTSNAVAAVLVVATAAAAGYFVHATAGTEPSATPVSGTGAVGTAPAGTGSAGPQAGPGAKPGVPGAGQPCVTTPVATSGGSGTTTTAPAPACAPGANGANGANGSPGAPPIAHSVANGERGD